MDLKELVEEFESDFSITQQNLQDKIYKIPNIHAKWLRRYFREKLLLCDIENDLNVLYRQKAEHYRINYDFPLKTEKALDVVVVTDKEYSQLNSKYKRKKAVVEFLSEVVTSCKSLTYNIRNMVEYQKFVDGS